MIKDMALYKKVIKVIGKKRFFYLVRRNFLFWFSRKTDYPLVSADALQVNFTFNCNLRCTMCSMHERMLDFKAQGRPYELEIPTIKKMIKESSQMGVRSLILIGGEPFLEPRLFELISFAKECCFDGITVVTNGTLFTERNIQQMFESGLDNLSISIDSASEEGIARIRGAGVMEKIIRGINLLNEMKEKQKRHNHNIVSVCTIMNQNLEEITDVVGLCRRLKIARIIFQPVVADNTDQRSLDFNSEVFVPENRLDILDQTIEGLIKYKIQNRNNFDFIANNIYHLGLMKKYFRRKLKPRVFPCYAGYNRIQLTQDGKLYFCVNQEKSEATLGDVTKESLRQLWFSAKAKFFRSLIRKCKFPCLQWCAYRDDFIELSDSFRKAELF